MRIQPHCFPLRYDNHATNLSQLSANNIYSARKNSNTRHGNHSQHASPQAIFHCRNHILHFMLSLQLANTHHSPFLQQLVASLATSHMHSVQLWDHQTSTFPTNNMGKCLSIVYNWLKNTLERDWRPDDLCILLFLIGENTTALTQRLELLGKLQVERIKLISLFITTNGATTGWTSCCTN